MAKRSKKRKGPLEIDRIKVAEGKKMLPGKSSGFPSFILLQALIIAGAVLWIYRPAFHGGWLWDDNVDITENPITQSPTGLWSIWFAPGSQVDYYPVKASVQWLQWHLWSMDTLGYHLTNVFLHILSALLVWRLLSKFRLRLAWLGGLIFAIHPVQVESVAWITELKNTLSLPPFLLAMCAYLDYEEQGKSKDYFLALGLFLLAMLSKTTMVMFPVVILLYAWWKRGRIGWKDVQASTPFFLVSLALGLLTIWLQHHDVTQSAADPLGGIFSRLACAGLSLSFYFSKCFLPVEMMPVYPQWTVDPPALWQFLPWPFFGGAIYWLWTKRRDWGRHALLGLGFFLIFLAPFLGFKLISYMNFTWVMDHFLYIPIIGLIGLVVAALGDAEKRVASSFRPCGIGLVTALLAFLAFQSCGYAKMFINQETLWTYELQHNPAAWVAHNNLGSALFQTGRLPEAIDQYQQALRINPDFAMAHENLGFALMKAGRMPEAIDQYQQALRIYPDYALAHHNLGGALLQTGHPSEAIEQFELALRINPDYASAHNNLGNALQQTGRLPEAIEQFELALLINPDDAEFHTNLGSALFQAGRLPEAMEQYGQALRLKPDDADSHNNLGLALLQMGRAPEAIEQYQHALRIDPQNASAHRNLGTALLQTRHFPEALEQFEQALQIKPDDAGTHNNLGSVLWIMGRQSEAIRQFEQSLQINPLDAETHYNLGYALQQTGHIPEAIEQYEEALQIKPDFAAARNKLVKLHAIQKAAPAQN
jgi:tetratricopeptide (TPR) repeat protein